MTSVTQNAAGWDNFENVPGLLETGDIGSRRTGLL